MTGRRDIPERHVRVERRPDQDPGIQVAALQAAGCGAIRTGTASGASREGRGGLRNVLDFPRAGDGPGAHRLDRPGRSTRDAPDPVHGLDGRGAPRRVLEPEVTTAGEPGRLAVTVPGMVADMELGFIRDRQCAGTGAAKARGVYRGRGKRIDDGRIRELAARQVPRARIARGPRISRMSVYRALKDRDGWGEGPGRLETADV